MLAKSLSRIGLSVALLCVWGTQSASANVIYDYSYNFRFVSTTLEYSSPVYITTPTDVLLANLTFAFCTGGCPTTFHFGPASPSSLGFDIAFDNLFPAGALTHNGTYNELLFFDSLTVSGSPAPTVPEPASAALAALGLVVLALRQMRTRSRSGLGTPSSRL